MGPIFPRILQGELEAAVRAAFEPVLSHGRAQDVAAQSLQLLPVVAVNHLPGIDTEAGDFGNWLIDRLIWARLGPV